MWRDSEARLRSSRWLLEAGSLGSHQRPVGEESDWDQELDDEPEYKKQLFRLFGPRMANYFFQPLQANPHLSLWVSKLLEWMGDGVGAEELWRIIREDSKSHLLQIHSPDLQACALGNWSGTKASDPLRSQRRRVNAMYTISQLNRAKTTLILSKNLLPDLNDSQGQVGPMRFLTRRSGAGKASGPEVFKEGPKCGKVTFQQSLHPMGSVARNNQSRVKLDLNRTFRSCTHGMAARDIRHALPHE
eukprot:gi/632946475/ref/XP_007888577.1/ PREDICTED: uncharacterized protein LOC103176692 [Callorhinchus milii]